MTILLETGLLSELDLSYTRQNKRSTGAGGGGKKAGDGALVIRKRGGHEFGRGQREVDAGHRIHALLEQRPARLRYLHRAGACAGRLIWDFTILYYTVPYFKYAIL